MLHFSDLHSRAARETETWRRRRVLGEAWERNVDALTEDGPVDLVFFTGDAADWGLPEEFEAASEFFLSALEKLKVPRERFFIIPGNHDVRRDVELPAWQRMRALFAASNDTLDIARWAAGGKPPFGAEADLLDRVLGRLQPYSEWVATSLQRPELAPRKGSLGFHSELDLGLAYPVHVIGLNTAWMCGDDSDSGRLWALDDQLMRLVSDPQGGPLQGLRILLMHHPFDQLADGAECRALLAGRVDLVLRGHLHKEEVGTWSDPGNTIRQLAAGCLYESWRADYWPNSCHLLNIESNPAGQPHRINLRFRAFSPRSGHWYDDDSLYSETRNGRLTWYLPQPTPADNCAANPYDPWSPAVPPAFVGRGGTLARLRNALDEGRSVSLVGDWRIGKSSLLTTCMLGLQKSGRTAKLLSGEGREGTSPAVFVECATGVRPGDTPDAAADTLSNWARQASKPGLLPILLIDEFDAVVTRFDARFFERLRGMLDYLCLVVSSRQEIDRIYKDIGRTSPFVNRLELCWVGLIEDEAAEQLAKRSAPVLPASARAMVREWAGRHPFFIQLFGRKLVDSCRYGESADNALEQFLAEGGSRLRELWGTLTERDRQILRAAVDAPQLQSVARSLRQRGLLTEQGRPFGRLLTEWLVEDNR
ncbi:MAG: metallophosphoesterase [Candidatus Solibacter sp.]|nr:metallophosphoesterase [Candidatus Solibacter sp.]